MKEVLRSSYGRSLVGFAAFTIIVTACFQEPSAGTAPEDNCDPIGVADLTIEPATPAVGTAFEAQWTDAGFFARPESPVIEPIFGNANITILLTGPSDLLPAEISLPFDYDFGGAAANGIVERPASIGIAQLLPTFADLTPGEYSLSVDVQGVVGLCPPTGFSDAVSTSFEISPGFTCVQEDVDLLDLEVRDLVLNGPPLVIRWSVDYLVEAAAGVAPNEVTLVQEVTVTDAANGAVLGSDTIVSDPGNPLLSGDSVTETVPLQDLLNQVPQGDFTIRVEVRSAQLDAECGIDPNEIELNNALEITTSL